MPTKSMTVTWIDSLKPNEKQVDYFDQKQPGLVLRVGRRDKVWYLVYRVKGQERKRRLRIGIYPSCKLSEAREKAHADINKAKGGEDPALEIKEERDALEFNSFVNLFYEQWDAGDDWKKEARRLLDRDVLPRLGKRKTKDIRRRDIIWLMDEISKRGADTTARRTLAVVRKILNWAVDREVIEVNPAFRVKGPGKERKKERVFTRDEVKKFWEGLDSAKLDTSTRLALKFILVTGQRPGEVRSMKWDDIESETRIWTLPKTKSGRTHRVPLGSFAQELIDTSPKIAPYVFAGRSSDKPMASSSLASAMRNSIAEMEDVNPATPHDLRRTAGTLMAEAGVPRLVISKVLNHAEGGVTAIYDRHGYDNEKSDALNRLETTLRGLLSMEAESKIVKFPNQISSI